MDRDRFYKIIYDIYCGFNNIRGILIFLDLIGKGETHIDV